MDSWVLYRKQSISTDKCEKSTEEWSLKEILEFQHENKEIGYVLQQVEEKVIVEEEEVVEDLGEVEQEVDSKLENTSKPSNVVDDFVEVVEPSSTELEDNVEEDNAQPPRHIINNERLEEVDQEASSTIEDDSMPTNVSFEIDEPSSLCYEIDDKEDRAQPPTHHLSNEGCIEEVGEQGIDIEDACQEVEVFKDEYKGVELTRSLGPSLLKSPSNTTFK
ncbi:hypothetical protein AHAS_Ahas16G0199800 [Arachis hypogaea]